MGRMPARNLNKFWKNYRPNVNHRPNNIISIGYAWTMFFFDEHCRLDGLKAERKG